MKVLAKKDWGAKIVSLDEFARLRPKLGKIVATSGGYDPIHPGHVSSIIKSKKYGDTLVVLVQSDYFLSVKKGRPFQNVETRCLIVSGIQEVDYVIPFEDRSSQGMEKALDTLKPDVFTKGGDRMSINELPAAEVEALKKNNIQVVFGVGESKKWSSSWFLEDWERTRRKAKRAMAAKKVKETLEKYLPKED